MFETDDLIYVHCPKTGGIFVERVLHRERSGRSLMGVHDPATQVSKEIARGRPIVGTVRNPWDWYVSFYHYALETCAEGERAPGLLAYGRGQVGFRDFLWGATHLDQVKVPSGVGVFWVLKGLGTRTVQRAQERRVGLCTLAYEVMYGDPRGSWICTHFIDTARLHEGLWEVAKLDMTRKAMWAPQNVGCHAPAGEMFDDEARSWVEGADREMVELGEYGGPGRAASWAWRRSPMERCAGGTGPGPSPASPPQR